MVKSSVAVRTPSRRSPARAAASKTKPTRRKAEQPTTTNSAAARAVIPTPHNQPLTDAELEVIWKTYRNMK